MKFKNYKKAEKKYGVGGGDWMNLEEGENKVRIVSEFTDYGSHYNNQIKKSVICLGKKDCEICQHGDVPKVQYLGWVIDRKDQEVKLLRIGHTIFKGIGELANNTEYKFDDLPSYDITIIRKGEGKDTRYNTIAARKDTKLTEEEEKKISKLKDPLEIIDNMKGKQARLTEEEDLEISSEIEKTKTSKKKKLSVDDIPLL